MGVVDYTYFTETYFGEGVDEASFPALEARAEDIIGSLTHWVDADTLDGITLTLYKKAVCAEISYLAFNGLESVTASDGKGFTVGKVTVHDGASTGAAKAGNIVCPLSVQYLEQTGLMNPQVPTAPDIPFWGCWLC